jgi:hypothetical protein
LFGRYDIVNEADLRDAMGKLAGSMPKGRRENSDVCEALEKG